MISNINYKLHTLDSVLIDLQLKIMSKDNLQDIKYIKELIKELEEIERLDT